MPLYSERRSVKLTPFRHQNIGLARAPTRSFTASTRRGSLVALPTHVNADDNQFGRMLDCITDGGRSGDWKPRRVVVVLEGRAKSWAFSWAALRRRVRTRRAGIRSHPALTCHRSRGGRTSDWRWASPCLTPTSRAWPSSASADSLLVIRRTSLRFSGYRELEAGGTGDVTLAAVSLPIGHRVTFEHPASSLFSALFDQGDVGGDVRLDDGSW